MQTGGETMPPALPFVKPNRHRATYTHTENVTLFFEHPNYKYD